MRTLFYAVAAAMLAAWPAAANDTVEYVDAAGKKALARGQIREESRTEITMETANGMVRIPVHRIDSVKYDMQPAELVSIRSKFDQGRYQEVINDLVAIGKTLDEKDVRLQGAVLFGVFRAAAEWALGDPSKAPEALKWHARLMEGFSDGRHYYPAQELLGRVHLAAGDYDAAARAFSALRGVDWPGYREKALVYQGIADLQQNRFAEARSAFDQVLSANGTERIVQEQKHIASAYKGELLVRMQEPVEAEKVLRSALEAMSKEAVDVKAAAHNALGDALRAQQKPKEAALDGYLWVVVIYNKNAEQLARALYHVAQISEQLGQKERAQAMAARLKSEFPQSAWAKKLAP